ncbi:MAG TPA: homocitrate synthase [Candidatus Thermoplasmatota archaeon]|nr:homocitrate synthase [Candidatus Thermoplasmatota archaeon]
MAVKLLDSTLREGEQTPGVSFTLDEKLEIARRLDAFGIDYIEAGHPAVSPEIAHAVREVARLGLSAEIVAHSRAMRSDIDQVLKTDADWVGIFFSVADKRLEAHFRKNVDEAEKLITDCIRYAKSHGLKVRYTPEDTVRSNPDTVLRIARAAEAAGADRIGVADTTGYMNPFATRDFVANLVKGLAGSARVGIHCHNDLGMAVANSLAAVEGGASVIDVCVNGLGERTGIAPLAETAVALRLQRNEGAHWKLEELPGLSELVARHSGLRVPEQAPIVGANAFTHNAGLHVAAVLLDPRHYESIPVDLVGRRRRFVVDKMAGKPTIRYRLEELGLSATDDVVDAILQFVKLRHVNDASDEDLRRLHADFVAMRDIVARNLQPKGAS